MRDVPHDGEVFRGKLCRRGTSKTGRAFYNLQYWHGGRNNVRYVGESDYPVYAEAIAGYREFMRLSGHGRRRTNDRQLKTDERPGSMPGATGRSGSHIRRGRSPSSEDGNSKNGQEESEE